MITPKQLEKRERAIKYLNELKSTHTFKEIAEKTGLGRIYIANIYYQFCERIEMTKETKQRIIKQRIFPHKLKEEVVSKILKLYETHSIQEVAEKTNISYSSVWRIINGGRTLSDLQLNQYLTRKKEVKVIEKKEKKEEDETLWLDEKLVNKYTKEKQFNLTPLFFIKNHNVTPLTAKRICTRLQSQNNHEE